MAFCIFCPSSNLVGFLLKQHTTASSPPYVRRLTKIPYSYILTQTHNTEHEQKENLIKIFEQKAKIFGKIPGFAYIPCTAYCIAYTLCKMYILFLAVFAFRILFSAQLQKGRLRFNNKRIKYKPGRRAIRWWWNITPPTHSHYFFQ